MPTRDSAHAKAIVSQLIRALKRRGVDYADARYGYSVREHIAVQDDRVSSLNVHEGDGVGVRVLHKGAWGFAATPHTGAAALRKVVDQAIALAQAVASLNNARRALAPIEPAKAAYRSSYEIDPFDVPLEKKLDYLFWASHAARGPDAVKQVTCHMDFLKKRTVFGSTEGAEIDQTFIESGAGIEIVAQQGNRTHTRSFPNSHEGALAQAGYEYVKRLDLVGGAAAARQEALSLLRAEPPKAGKTTVILHPTQVVMQLHESCGHPAELDRALGQELSYAGGSFLTPEKLGKLWYGSPLVNIVADATAAGGVGSFAYDDEGVPGQRIPLVQEGLFVGYLSSRESAAQMQMRASGGAMRAESWNAPPLIRMTNVNLEPGEGTLEELLKDVKHGYLLSTNKSWSIDDKRLNFQFATEIGWEIEDGKLGRVVSHPLYTGITPEFWGKCSGVGRKEDWQLWGVPNCAKGEPMQLMHVGHGASYARFENVTVAPAL